MIKLAYVINYITNNGPSRVVLDIIKYLNKEKFDISLITLLPENDAEIIDSLQRSGIKIYECKTLSRVKCLQGKCKEFNKIIGDNLFDIIHSHGIIPDILSSRVKISAKKVSTIHNNMFEDYLDSYGYIKSRIFIALHVAALKKLDLCVCCSKSVYDALKIYLANTTYIRNGIEPVKAHSVVTREELGIPGTARLFLYAGALNIRKNVVWLIKNFVKYRNNDEYLLVLGQGEREAECHTAADGHVKLLGFQSDPAAYMQISDVYISASRSEGFSISVLEAISMGVGLFLSDVPSHREMIEMASNIYIGELFSEESFATKIGELRNHQFHKEEISHFQCMCASAKKMSQNYQSSYKQLLCEGYLWKR